MLQVDKNLIIVVSGPSGVGKTSVVKGVMSGLDDLVFSVSHTTRSPRGKEKEGRDYYFVSRKEFMRMIDRKEFAEWAEVYNHFYGTSKKELNRRNKQGDVLLDIDVQGAISIKKLFPDSVRILIVPPSREELLRRLKGRKDTSEKAIKERFEKSVFELSLYNVFTHIVVNNNLEVAVDKVSSIIKGERQRTKRMEEFVKELL